MATYRNVNDGRTVERPAGRDKWLDKSAAWELVEPEAVTEPKDNERTDDHGGN